MTPAPPLRPSGERFLVTGAHGYIGRALTRALRCLPDAQVYGLDRAAPEPLPASAPFDGLSDNYHAYQGDLAHPGLSDLLAETRPDVIFHAAAAPRTASLAEQLDGGALATERLLRAIADARLGCRVILLGSAAEYGLRPSPARETDALAPQGDYGVAKAAQTLTALSLASRLSLPLVVGRLFNIYGGSPPTLAIASLASQIAALEASVARRRNRLAVDAPEDPRLRVENLAARRDWIHLDDVTAALLALRRAGRPGEIYNIAGGEAVSVQAIAEQLLALSDLDADEAVLTPSVPPTPDCSQAAIDKICDETGWRPRVALADGLLRELMHWRQQSQRGLQARTPERRGV